MRTSKEGPKFRGQTKQKTGREKSHKERILRKLEGLKGQSHEIDFKYFDKNLQNLVQVRDAAGPMILKRKKYIYCG